MNFCKMDVVNVYNYMCMIIYFDIIFLNEK